MESRGFIYLKWAADGLLAHEIESIGLKPLKWAADGLLAHEIEFFGQMGCWVGWAASDGDFDALSSKR